MFIQNLLDSVTEQLFNQLINHIYNLYICCLIRCIAPDRYKEANHLTFNSHMTNLGFRDTIHLN